MGYRYFDSPVGEDTHKKLWFVTKLTGSAGIMISTCDVVLHSHPKTYLHALGRYVYITGPLIGIGLAHTAGTNMAASIRKKDDQWNYLIGAISGGSVVGAWRKCVMTGFVSTLAFAAAGFTVKYGLDEGWRFFKTIKTQYNVINTKQYDYTLVAERERGWTTGKE